MCKSFLSPNRFGWPLVLAWVVSVTLPTSVWADPPYRYPVCLPPARGATAASTYIHSQAVHLVARGQFLESVAVARTIHADAASKEMDNHLKWINTYFEGRRLNREYREIERESYFESQAKRQQSKEQMYVEAPYLQSETDISDVPLNFMLRYMRDVPSVAPFLTSRHSSVVVALEGIDVQHLRLTDGAHKFGRKLIVRASDGQTLQTDWPFILQAPEFAPHREFFEKQRAVAMRQIAEQGKLSYETGLNLQRAADNLTWALEEHYPLERRNNSRSFVWYRGAKVFLQQLALNVYRVLETNDQAAMTGGMAFKGNTAGDLVLHMVTQSLEFAPPEPGDERAYRRLFSLMRNMYVNLKSQVNAKPAEAE